MNQHRRVSREALKVHSKKQHKNQKEVITKWSKAPPERQWKLSTSWKVISLSLYPDYISWKPEKWDELIQTGTTTSTGSDLNEHCKRNVNWRLEVNIYQNKNYILKEKPVLYSSIHLCTRLAYLYRATIECSVSRYYDMIWNHTAVSTSFFTDFPCKNLATIVSLST